MVLHAVLSDVHRKKCRALLDSPLAPPFNIKEMGHSKLSEVTGRSLINLEVQVKLNCMVVFFFF